MTTRVFDAKAIASVDIYIPDDKGEWVMPLSRGMLLGFEGDDGYVLLMSGAIRRHPLEWLRAVATPDAEQPYPPKSPATHEREGRELLEQLYSARPRKRRAMRVAA